jgi:type IV secretory pathway TrbL component
MHQFMNTNMYKKPILLLVFIAFISLFSLDKNTCIIGKANAQEQVSSEDSTLLNSAQKSVFTELKKAAGENKNTRQSLIMIALVIGVVLLAMWLAFRGGNDSKPQAFSRTPKKQI